MYHYLYTNDMRISNLEERAKEYANMFLTDSVPEASEDKSTNNSAKTIGYYLNLENKDNSAILAANGDVRSVILNFIKTFQYPNPRTMKNFKETVSDGIELAPLREIIKILFLYSQKSESNAYLSKEEIINFIFYNDNLAKKNNVDRVKVISDIEEFRERDVLSSAIAPIEKRHWNHQDRQIDELLKILIWSGFIKQKDDRYFLSISKDDSKEYKAELLDIITYNKYWEYPEVDKLSDLRDSYYEYVDEQIINQDDYTNKQKLINNKLDRTIQDLYFGAPGTGKSYRVTQLIKECYPNIDEKDNPFVFKTTVYPDYSYYNFVGNIMPTTKDDEITYDFKPGIFTQALTKAFINAENDVFLVIEEMSRGNIASIFGDIFQLLDRDKDGISEYSINNDLISLFLNKNDIKKNKIYLPGNLHIIGTVNTSDQNVHVIDTAFKRRFGFIYTDVEPVFDNGKILNSFSFEFNDGSKFEWNKLYMSLNKFITEKLELSEDKQIGQFFIKFDNIVGENSDKYKYKAIQNKLLHYLWDDVQNASLVSSTNIFNDKYKTFSSLYKAFGLKENIFSDEFLELYENS